MGDPVEVDDGAKLLSIPLFSAPGEMGLKYTLYYQSVTGSSIWDYNPWRSSIDYDLDLYCGFTNPNISCSKVTYYRPDGSSVSFSGNHASYGNFPEMGGGGLATLVHNTNGTWILHDEDSNTLTFDTSGYFTSIKDVSGVGWTLSSSATTNGVPLTAPPIHPCDVPTGLHPMCVDPNPPPPTHNVTTTTTIVTHTDGQSYKIVSVIGYFTTYMTGSVTVTDPAGNQYSYVLSWYQAPGGSGLWSYDLSSLTFPGPPATTMAFSYTGANQLLSGVSYNGTAYWSTSYNSNNEVSSDGAADGTERTSLVYATNSDGMTATITNPLGLTTTNTYTVDSQGNYLLAKVSNSAVQGCGSTTNTLAWDANDNLTRTVDNDGITHMYSYAANGQLQMETEGSGTAVARTTNYAWDPNAQLNRLLSVTIPGETKTSYTYNAQNRVASATRTNLTAVGTANQTLTTTYAYTLYGNSMVETMTVTQPSPSGSDHTTYAYDSHGNLTSVTDGLGHVTTHSGYNGLGGVGKVVGPNGDETDYTYDARGRVASRTTHPNGTTATWTYTYDGFGLLANVSAPDGEVTTWSRDAEKRVKTITHDDKDGTSTETFGYDANGDVTSDVVARGSDVGKSTSYVYNALGKVYQVKGAHGQVLTYGYDGNGNVLSVTDALGHKTSHTYDALDRVSSVTNAAGGITHFTYDAGDHVTNVTDPRGLVTGYAWDAFGDLWQQQSPDTGTTNYGYDAYGRLSSFYRADGVVNAYGYDALNRVTVVTAGGSTRTFTWDNCTDGKGRLCTAATSADSVDYSYTPEGWIAARAFSFTNGPVYDIGYGYNALGQVTTIVYPGGNEALYDYTDGAVADVRMKVGTYNITGVSGVTYRPMDLAMSNWTSYNGLANTITYDSDLRPTAITVPNVESLAFNYDAANRITSISNGMDGSQSETLGYDAVGRLTSVASTAENESYQYDADGNRTHQVLNGVATTFYVNAYNNHMVEWTSNGWTEQYTHNSVGNLFSYSGGQETPPVPPEMFYYDGFNRLVQSDVGGLLANFDVSAEGQRLRKSTVNGTTYFAPGAGGELWAEKQDSGVWVDYVWLNGRLVQVMTSNGGVYPVHDDQTGRPLAMTNIDSHAVIWQAQDQPFDRKVTTTTWFDFNIGFPGQYYDSESGLWQNGNRDYDASTGRYIESDPVGLAGGVNTYAYVGNNPISNVDPLGLCDQQKCAQASAVVAALGKALSSTGSGIAWTGIGITSASVLGGIFAPEGAEFEIEGGIDGVSMITAGSRLSALGGVLTGYAANGFAGAVENGLAAAVLDKFDEGVAGLALPEGTTEATTHAVAGVLGEASDAVLAEQAACVGH